jgi:hypothetical protein
LTISCASSATNGLSQSSSRTTIVAGSVRSRRRLTSPSSWYLTDGVQRALGRPPRDFADYARDVAVTGVWEPAP